MEFGCQLAYPAAIATPLSPSHSPSSAGFLGRRSQGTCLDSFSAPGWALCSHMPTTFTPLTSSRVVRVFVLFLARRRFSQCMRCVHFVTSLELDSDMSGQLNYMPSAACFFDEFLGTFILVVVVFAVTDKHNGPPPAGLLPLVIFLLVLGLGAGWGMQTGYAINPARGTTRLFA